MNTIREKGKFSICNNVVACELDDGRALLDLNESQYYRLNHTAAIVWEWLEQGSKSIDELTIKMLSRFDVEECTCRADLAIMLKSFSEAGLIERAHTPTD